MIITVFNNIYDKDNHLWQDELTIFGRIRDGYSKDLIEQIRGLKDKKARDELKRRLPSICFSGKFSKRGESYLLEYSGLMCLDIDQVNEKDMVKVRKILQDDVHTMACFVSPSGNGFKVIINVAPEKNSHKDMFRALEKEFNKKLNVFKSTVKSKKEFLPLCIDKSGKDVSRVCYESYDPDLYYNPDSEMWVEVLEKEIIESEVKDPDLIIEIMQKWIDKKEQYYKGNRNNFLYQFSSSLCRSGVQEMRTMTYLRNNYGDYPLNELETTVKGAYKANEFGILTFTEKQRRTKHVDLPYESDDEDITAFWDITSKGKVDIDTKLFLKFIEANGFGIYRQRGSVKHWDFVKVENMIVEVVGVIDIKRHVLDYLVRVKAPQLIFNEIQMKNRYFENTFLNALQIIDVDQVKDTQDKSFVFFDKFYYEVTKDDINQKSYIDFKEKGIHIWRNQICKKEMTELVDYKNHDYNIFLQNAFGKDKKKYLSVVSSLGYALHTFKKQRSAKLIYACEESLDELDDLPKGGTGKKLLFQCLEYVRSVVYIDGKDWDGKDKFKLQSVKDETQIVVLDDFESDIKDLFPKVTGHFSIEKKGMDKVDIEFERSPKLLASSNKSPKGHSDSYSRRLQILSLTNHYNAKHTPADEFGDKDFFSEDWNQDDWNCLYSFLMHCLKYYLKHGIQITETKGLFYKYSVKNCGYPFAEWMYCNTTKDFSNWQNGKEMLDFFKAEFPDVDMPGQKFYKYMRVFADIHGLKCFKKGMGKTAQVMIENFKYLNK